MQFTPEKLSPQIQSIALASARMNRRDSRIWQSRLELVYGEMNGQRAVDFSALAGDLDRHATIIGLETLYYLVSVLISRSALESHPADYLRLSSRLPKADFDRFVAELLDGRTYEQRGILGCRDVYPLGWLADDDRLVRQSLRDLIAELVTCWDQSQLAISGDDPLQTIHRQLFPTNLTHITGQVFTPEWMAELLIADSGWEPGQTLIDPFCGSGVFLVKTLRRALELGCDPEQVLADIVGIDLNPFAAAAARANLVLMVARNTDILRGQKPIHLNVLSADAIRPSVLKSDLAGRGDGPPASSDVWKAAQSHGLDLRRWRLEDCSKLGAVARAASDASRIEVDQQLACCLAQADVLATNPPWVGWEYLSRPYRDSLRSAWTAHDLFQAKGIEASFLKEDLSNLALLAAWDAYLRDGGRSVVVLRPSTMHSELASRGVRRLSLSEDGIEIELQQIRTFDGLRPFPSARADAATWTVRKGRRTNFPVPVTAFEKCRPRWNPCTSDRFTEFTENVTAEQKLAEPTDPDDPASRWMIASEKDLRLLRPLRGGNGYRPRMGVFTGGANGVFYLQRANEGSPAPYRNLTARSKRAVAEVDVDVEPALVHSVARGRDIEMWLCRPKVELLFPHTRDSGMRPIGEATLRSQYPKAYGYLTAMREPLEKRNGFAGWEKRIHADSFYTLQRIGPYTFAPYKVCWRYIASEFTVCVLERDGDGKTIVPNDKVMFIPFADPEQAYFVAGFLSSNLARRYVNCVADKRQISTRVIKSLWIPVFNPESDEHQVIRECCHEGHKMLSKDQHANVSSWFDRINETVDKMLRPTGRLTDQS